MSDESMLAAMVNKDADPVNVEASFAGQVCCISAQVPNRLLLLNCPGQLYTFLHSALRTSYRLGIDREQGQQWITLHGTPFMAPGPGQNAGPQIFCALIKCMLNCGWQLMCDSTVSLRVIDLNSMFFEKAKVVTQGVSVYVCALTFIGQNMIQLTDAPLAFVELLREVLTSHWKKGEKGAVTFKISNGVPQFQLHGRPWDSVSSADMIASRTLLAQVISRMKAADFRILTSCATKVTNAGMRPQELDTWIIQCPLEDIETSGRTDLEQHFKD